MVGRGIRRTPVAILLLASLATGFVSAPRDAGYHRVRGRVRTTRDGRLKGVEGGIASTVEIVKSVRDDRSYRHLILPNDLEVVLISDSKTETAAGSMFIKAGHMQDPLEFPGMAHFHEHMLFLGTEKHPEEGSFESFLTSHGGWSNAYTSLESTNYYFSVEASHLEEASDRFSQFFQTPLFSSSALGREMQAVDSEHKNNVNSDQWRIFQVKSWCLEFVGALRVLTSVAPL
ncbi:unnamed protein product [Choristocarpus tenellus]